MSDPFDDLEGLQQRCLEDLVRTTTCIRRWLEEAVGDPCDPGPDATWAVSEHVLHCVLVMESVARGFARRDRLVAVREPSAKRLAVLTTWRIPAATPAPERVVPGVILPPDPLRARLTSARDELLPRVRELAGGEPPGFLPHFLLGPMTRVEWFRFLLIHARHHEDVLVARGQVGR